MATTSTTDFDQLGEQLSVVGVGPAEAQGLLCGLLCAGTDDALALWLQELNPEQTGMDDPCRNALNRLFQETLEAFEGPGVGFELLLPDEDQPLKQRASALIDWCQGFLYGLGLTKAPLDGLSQETQEGLKDITEVTKLDLDALSDSEEEEIDLTEITEFIWVAAMLVREELVHHPRGE
ncbi:MAG: UPF0149 family protein [Gammaproteobacteria bacterium]|nr:UPF0149 family protein [Gammaproteobacteria bacterium]MBU1656258.1 UPF0149 family protein [Gammaproteobacteria bacterium]MBU1959823.1 UPF0149 family protein [Gammaproteobacteria bacterium]